MSSETAVTCYDHTFLSGAPTLAPNAAGTSKPIVPKPPDEIHEF